MAAYFTFIFKLYRLHVQNEYLARFLNAIMNVIINLDLSTVAVHLVLMLVFWLENDLIHTLETFLLS